MSADVIYYHRLILLTKNHISIFLIPIQKLAFTFLPIGAHPPKQESIEISSIAHLLNSR
jgi:hypothetical protein